MIDRVLASPHYGERWGRHWLDLARYADSDGYEKDRMRPHAWRYRTWVVNALNADLPYNQFSIEQIAGDMLPNATLEQRVASGFHRNTLHNTEGGTDQEEDRVKKTVDRTNTVGAIWMGMTVGCAQCHSHKYDPLTQREYYQLYAFFNDINETDIDAPLPIDAERLQQVKEAFDAEHAKLKAAVTAYESEHFAAAQAKWETTALNTAVVWQTLEPKSVTSKHRATLKRQEDGSWLASGKNEVSDVYTIDATVDAKQITAIRLEVLPDTSLVKSGPGRADNGNFVLTGFRVATRFGASGSEAEHVELVGAKADFSQSDWDVAQAINGDPMAGWAVSPEIGKRHVAVFETQQAIQSDGPIQLSIVLDQTYNRSNSHNIGRFRLSVTSGDLPATLEGLPADVAAALSKPADGRDAKQQESVTTYFRSVDPELVRLNKVVADHAKKMPKDSGVKAQSIAQVSQSRQANIHIRGDFLNKGEPVVALTPSVLPGLEANEAKLNRLDFARWLFAVDNPLTARVTVNRVWQRIFGRGIVSTVDDFGLQGEQPTHPELLDWLAVEFMDSRWDVKALHRRIVHSAVYRQDAAISPQLLERDPDNLLLARGARFRVEGEVVRDITLAASGLLNPAVGGPSVYPPAPQSIFLPPASYGTKTWEYDEGADKYRRGLYTFRFRSAPFPALQVFDTPSGEAPCTGRERSNTPLQALTVLNEPLFFESAVKLAETTLAEGGEDDRARLAYAFQRCTSRAPEAAEVDALVAFLEKQRARIAAGEIDTAALLSATENRDTLAAWTLAARVLLNLDETITRQ